MFGAMHKLKLIRNWLFDFEEISWPLCLRKVNLFPEEWSQPLKSRHHPPQGLLSQESCLPLDSDAETVWSRLVFHTLSILQL